MHRHVTCTFNFVYIYIQHRQRGNKKKDITNIVCGVVDTTIWKTSAFSPVTTSFNASIYNFFFIIWYIILSSCDLSRKVCGRIGYWMREANSNNVMEERDLFDRSLNATKTKH